MIAHLQKLVDSVCLRIYINTIEQRNRTGERTMANKTYNVSFFNTAGECLGTVEVQASTTSKAKILAATLYTCSWVYQTVEAA